MATATIMAAISAAPDKEKNDDEESVSYEKGLKALCDANLIKAVPNRFIFPSPERPKNHHIDATNNNNNNGKTNGHFKLPVIHFDQLQGPNRPHLLRSLAHACEKYGFFQVVNHGISEDVISNMREVTRSFFDLPVAEREKYMSSDVSALVRYGTSFNQTKDGVFCWRDFLKLVCDPRALPHWPSNSPFNFRKCAVKYAKETKALFLKAVEAIVESLDFVEDDGDQVVNDNNNTTTTDENDEEKLITELKNGSQYMMLNYYPQCPNPDLTLGIPPHSDFDFLTLLLQDDVNGLQIHHRGDWVAVDVIPNALVVNVGDLLEQWKYKSVMHRAVVNSFKPRISVASFHSVPVETIVEPSPKLISNSNPRRYKGTNFSTFLEYIKTSDYKKKNFLESRKLLT